MEKAWCIGLGMFFPFPSMLKGEMVLCVLNFISSLQKGKFQVDIIGKGGACWLVGIAIDAT